MRNRLRLSALVTLALAALTAVGCGRQEGTTHPDLQAALVLLEESTQGYVAAVSTEGEAPPSNEQFRQQKLDEALPKLEAAAQSTSGEQQRTARRLIADVHAAAGRYIAGEAMDVYADLGASAKDKMVTQLRVLDRVASRVELFKQDRSVVEQKLTEAIQQQTQARESITSSISQLQSRIDELQSQRNTFREQAETARGEQHELRGEANVVGGDQSYELMDEAAAAARRADEAEAEAEKLQANIDRLSTERDVKQGQLEQAESSLQALNEQRDTWRNNEQQRDTRLAEAEQQLDAAADALVEQFKATSARFMEQVHQPLNAAEQRFASAVEMLDRIQTEEAQENRSLLQDELTRLRSEHRGLIDDLERVVGGLAGRLTELAPERAEAFATVTRQLDDARQSIGPAESEPESGAEAEVEPAEQG